MTTTMTTTTTTSTSMTPTAPTMLPLDQVHASTRVTTSGRAKRLSLTDQATVRRILDEKYDCIHHEWFELPAAEAERLIFDEAEDVPKPDTAWYHPLMDDLGQQDRPQAASTGTVLLTAKQERTIFLQFNYCRHVINQIKAELLEQPEIDPARAREMLDWHAKAERLRTQIADTNLALVLAMAKRVRASDMDFADLVSEGNMALLRAVDKFDAARGFKFSTYACRAILKAFSRNGIKHTQYRRMFPTNFDPTLERSNHQETKNREHELDCAAEVKRIVNDNIANLSDIEQQVIQHRFHLTQPVEQASDKPLTLEEVGRIIGVTKERVRQIQNKALTKIKSTLEEDFLL